MERQAYNSAYAVFKAGAEVQYRYFPRFSNVIISNKTNNHTRFILL